MIASTRIPQKLVESVPDLVYTPRKLGIVQTRGIPPSPISHSFCKRPVWLFSEFKESVHSSLCTLFCKSFKGGRSRTWEEKGEVENGAADDRQTFGISSFSVRYDGARIRSLEDDDGAGPLVRGCLSPGLQGRYRANPDRTSERNSQLPLVALA